jgi:peptide-methionine (R)-S-oxide reductase
MDKMNRRSFVRRGLGLVGLLTGGGLVFGGRSLAGMNESRTPEIEKLEKTAAEWSRYLPRDSYRVLFDEYTERPFSSPLYEERREGVFICAACYLPLFDSATKFDSGTGWPSFTAPIEGHVQTRKDFSLLVPRTEYHCARCGGHQGHIFKDGPKPTGQRWCNNGLALRFFPKEEDLPELRI